MWQQQHTISNIHTLVYERGIKYESDHIDISKFTKYITKKDNLKGGGGGGVNSK